MTSEIIISLLEPFYFIAYILVVFFWGYKFVFGLIDNLDFNDEAERIILFILLVILLAVSGKAVSNFLIGLKFLGFIVVVGIYIFSYLTFKKEIGN